MSFAKRRIYKRKPFVESIRYFIAVSDMRELDKINNLEELDKNGVTVDISKSGLGLITEEPLKKGDILFFEHEIKVNDISAIASIVRWSRAIEYSEHRVGLKFIK